VGQTIVFRGLSRLAKPQLLDRFEKPGGAGAFACQPQARIKSWQAEAPAPPFLMKFRGPKAHPNKRQKPMSR
jgi:hypothetical protein